MKCFLIMFFFFSVCSQPKDEETKTHAEKIKSISIWTYGGEMGYSKSLKMTTDYLYFDFSLAVDSTKRRNEKKLNNLYQSEDIISSNELISFSKIRNGKSRLPIDGTDTEIIIETEKNKYSVINAEGNNIWKKIQNKMNSIINVEFKPQ